MNRLIHAVLSLSLVLAACGPTPPSEEETEGEGSVLRDLAPDGHGGGTTRTALSPSPYTVVGGGSNGITYHGGPVMLGTPTVYFIWYGNWSGNSATVVLQDLAQNIGGSAYYDIAHTYDDGLGRNVSNAVAYGGAILDNYSRGTNLVDADIQAIVAGAINSGRLPNNASGIYFVFTSADVSEGGFCSQFCGWHTHGTLSGTDIKYAFVGNSDRCPSACRVQEVSPNGNAAADGMASVFAHELEETTTDPHLNAWYDSTGEENADKCAWTFGNTYRTSNGASANLRLGTRDYFIQRNWVNASGGYCALSWLGSGNNHFYTTSAAERDSARNSGYTYEGIAAYVYPSEVAGSIPLHRLLQPNGRHFYTTSTPERDALVSQGYTYEGVAAWVDAQAQAGVTSPFYRLVNSDDHLYTASLDERNNAIANVGYISEGSAGYVYTYATFGTVPLYRLNK